MDDFFAYTGPGDPGSPADRADTDPDLPDRPAPAAGTDIAALPFSPTGTDPAGRRPRLRRPGRPDERFSASAMRYRAGAQTVPSGGALALEVAGSCGEGAEASGDGGLLLVRGRYFVTFAADAEGRDAGAVFALNAAVLPFTASLLPGAAGRRIALAAVLDLNAAAILTVENNCGGDVTYRNAVLSALRLA